MSSLGQSIEPARRLSSLRDTEPGYVLMLRCKRCGHLGPLPVEILVRRYGVQTPLGTVLAKLKCAKCEEQTVEVLKMALCTPGCHRQRG